VPQFACKRGVPFTQEDADIIGPAVLEVVDECGGVMDKDDIVAAARRRNSPLHPYVFNKTQREAANAYYRGQANKLIQSFEVIWTQGGEQRRADLVYYVELVQPEDDEEEEVGSRRRNRSRRRGYVSATTAMDDEAYQQQILTQMEQELDEYRRRYEEFTHLLDFRTRFGRIFRSICNLFEDAA